MKKSYAFLIVLMMGFVIYLVVNSIISYGIQAFMQISAFQTLIIITTFIGLAIYGTVMYSRNKIMMEDRILKEKMRKEHLINLLLSICDCLDELKKNLARDSVETEETLKKIERLTIQVAIASSSLKVSEVSIRRLIGGLHKLNDYKFEYRNERAEGRDFINKCMFEIERIQSFADNMRMEIIYEYLPQEEY